MRDPTQRRRKGTVSLADCGCPESLRSSWVGGCTWTTVFSSHPGPCWSEEMKVLFVLLACTVSFLLYETRQCLSVCCPCRVFGFVARKQGSATDNICHLFAEHDPEQPASAIVNFVSKVMIGSQKKIWCLHILDSELFTDSTEGKHCERGRKCIQQQRLTLVIPEKESRGRSSCILSQEPCVCLFFEDASNLTKHYFFVFVSKDKTKQGGCHPNLWGPNLNEA